jgi:hypothetical protein
MKPGVFATLVTSMLLVPFASAQDLSPGKETLAAFPLGEERCMAQDVMAKNKGYVAAHYLYRVLRPNPADDHDPEDAAQIIANDRLPADSVSVSVIARFMGRKGEALYGRAMLLSGDYQGAPGVIFGLDPGAGDDVFRLAASTSEFCEAE